MLRPGMRAYLFPLGAGVALAASAFLPWIVVEDIGIALAEKFPGVDPLTIRFTDLREKVLALDGFDDDPKSSNEAKLEAIQMARYEEWKDAQ